MIKLSGIWKHNKPDSNEVYFTGNLGSARIVIFKNGFKEKENEPDFILYLDENKKKPLNDVPDPDEDVTKDW